MKKITATDGVPITLKGFTLGRELVVKFVHKCCGCGLRHHVEVRHKSATKSINIKFTRIPMKKEGED